MAADMLVWMLDNPGTVIVLSLVAAVVVSRERLSDRFNVYGLAGGGILIVAGAVFYLYATGGVGLILKTLATGIGIAAVIELVKRRIDIFAGKG